VWNSLYAKDGQLAMHVKKYSANFEEAFVYRNELVHDGLVDFKTQTHDPENNYPGFFIMLRNKSNNTSYSDDALKLCTKIKQDLLEVLDKSYELMYQYYKKSSSPQEV
jgi:hypothetical protein